MKSASAATIAILATGQYIYAELYEFTLTDGSHIYLTTSDAALTVGGQVYSSAILIRRQSLTQKIGLESQTLTLDLWPRESDVAAPTFAGFTLQVAAKIGILDYARVVFSKLFLSSWADTTPGAIVWFSGVVSNVTAGRNNVQVVVDDDLAQLNVAMPKNIVQTGCIYTTYDTGCGLNVASFPVGGNVTGTPTTTFFTTSLTQVSAYFDLGVLTFTSGANSGLQVLVKLYFPGGGISLVRPLATAPTAGDAFTVYPMCRKTQAACANTDTGVGPAFNNLARFRGAPYVPVPETLYDGGVAQSNSEVRTQAGQSGPITGSSISGRTISGRELNTNP